MHNYIVKENQRLNENTLLLTLKRENSERPLSFQPGQYAAISFFKGKKQSPTRCFSIVSSPTEQDLLQFSTRINGRFTRALSRLEENDIVNVYGPFGGFVFDLGQDKKSIFIAGGIGITPFISMMRYAATLKGNNIVNLFYSVASSQEVPFKDELLAIENNNPNLKTMFAVSHGDIADSDLVGHSFSGHIDAETIARNIDGKLTGYKFYICGPPPFMAIIKEDLHKAGVGSDKILTEAFTQATTKQSGILRSWPANVYALGAIGVILGSLIVSTSDLLKALPPTSNTLPTKNAPYLITNARQEQLTQLINAISPSPGVITLPSKTPQKTYTAAPSPSNAPPPSYAPVYLAPKPTTTVSKLP